MPFPKTPLSIDNKTKDNDMKKKQHLMTLAVLLLLASCSEQSDMQQTAIDTNAPVSLTASSGTAPLMRAADNLYNASTGFDGGEEAQVYMANSGGTQTGTAKFSIGAPEAVGALKQSTLTLADGDPIYYPSGPSGNVTLYGIYPAASISSHTVSYDQTSDANYKSSDLMYAKIPVSWSTLAEKYALKPNLPFQHQLVKLKVTIVKMEDVWHLEKVTMNNVKRSVTVAPTYTSAGLGSAASATGESGEGANEDAILISSGETASTVPETKVFTYACVYPAQTWNDGDENAVDFLTVKADGGVAKYKLKKTFQPGYEYTLTVYLNALAVGATVTIDNWGDATDCVVNPTTASGGTLKIAAVGDQTYTGNPITPAPAVTYTDKLTGSTTPLVAGTDYDLSYYNNTNAGQAIILATGKNGGVGHNYEGQIGLVSFYIIQRELAQASIADINAVTYKRAAWEPELTVTSNGKTLIKNVDYTVAFESNVNAGTATATITAVAEGNFAGTNSKTFTINKKSLSTNSSDFTITLSATSKVYNGSAQSVSVSSVKDSNSGNTATMTLTTEYTVSGTTSASAAGTYTVTVTGQGNYTDSKTADWSITKRPVTLTAKAGEITKGDESTYGTASSGKTFSSLTSSTYTTYVTASSGTNAGLASGHYVESIKLKPSTTSTVTTTGTLTPSAAVIKDASGNNVTSNYDITYATGTLTVKSGTQRGTIITDPTNSNFIKVYTSETSGYKIPKSDTQTDVVWENDASWGSQEQWKEIIKAVGGNDDSGYSVLNTKVSNASISGWTDMYGYYWTCTGNSFQAFLVWKNGWSNMPPECQCNVREVSAFTD